MAAPIILDNAPVSRVHVLAPASTAITKGDLVYATESSGNYKSFGGLADQGTPAKNYIYAARRFAGVAAESRTTGETVAESSFPIDTACEIEIDCESATFEPGDFVGPVETSGGDALESQKVRKTTSRAFAIGKVTRRYSSASTRIRVQLFSRVQEPTNYKVFPRDLSPAIETLSGARILTTAELQQMIVRLDPGGAGRNVDLPDAIDNAGVMCLVRNEADAAEILTIRYSVTDGSATVCTPTQNESALLFCDGTIWAALATFHN